MSCISSRVKVPEIQRHGLDIADIVDWDLKPHLNMCALRYNPTISALETLTPPEARLRTNGTIYKVKVRSQTPTPPVEWEPLSIKQLCLRYPLPYPTSKEELLGEVYISPSPSDSSIVLE